jgi:hypothetical protein
VVSRRQLLELGLSSAAVGRRIEGGRLHPLARGVYAVGHPLVGVDGMRWAAVLALGPDAVISHGTAADAWDMRRSQSAVVHVTVAPGGRVRRPAIRIHRTTLEPEEVTTLRGLPITTPQRTLLDLASTGLRGRALETALDRAELRCSMDFADLRRLLERHERRRGATRLAELLARYQPGSVDTLSVLEDLVLDLCDRHAIPRPLVNAVIEGRRRDFTWPHARLVVEADSYTWHRSPAALDEDRARDVELSLAGYRVLRFTYAQVTKQRGYVVRALRHVLA